MTYADEIKTLTNGLMCLGQDTWLKKYELFLNLLGCLDEKDALLKKAIEASICAVLVEIKKSNDLEVFLKSSQNLSFDFEAQLNNYCSKESLFSCGYLYLDWLFVVK